MSDDSDDDKITNIDDARAKRGRPRKPKVAKSDFLEPVGITFIAAALKVDKGVVQKRLAGMVPVIKDPHPRFDFAEAARRVIQAEAPRSSATALTLEQFASLRPDRFPKNTHSEFWIGMTKRREFYEKSNQMWSTEQVQDAFDAIIDVFRTAVMSIEDRVLAAKRDNVSLKSVQRDILTEVNKEVIRISEKMATRSMADEYSLWEQEMLDDAAPQDGPEDPGQGGDDEDSL